jgi:hypothetical protein
LRASDAGGEVAALAEGLWTRLEGFQTIVDG